MLQQGLVSRIAPRGMVACVAAITLLLLWAMTAQASFYVVAGGSKVGTPIRSAPYTITKPGQYFFDRNVTMLTGHPSAIVINAPNVTLNMNGFTLTGPGKAAGSVYGVNISGTASNVQILNGRVTQFSKHGVYADETNIPIDRSVINVTSYDNGQAGFFIQGALSRVLGCVAYANGVYGIFVNRPAIVEGNLVYANGQDGIFTATGSIIKNNVSYLNSSDGIVCSGGGCTMVGNNAHGNGGNGISTNDSSMVHENTATANAWSSGINLNLGTGVGEGTNVPFAAP